MALCLFDLGTFEQLEAIFEQNFQTKFLSPSSQSSTPKASKKLNNLVKSDSFVAENNSNNSDYDSINNNNKSKIHRTSVPQAVKSNRHADKFNRDQRLASVVGIPHRHNITIAVNDEPVDIIKTTCTGPCKMNTFCDLQKMSDVSSINSKILIDSRNEKAQKSLTISVIIHNIIYLMSFMAIRTFLTIQSTIDLSKNLSVKWQLVCFYSLSAFFTFLLTLHSVKFESNIKSQLKLFLAIIILLIWSGFNLINYNTILLTLLIILLLSIGVCVFWDGHIRVMNKWSRLSSTIHNSDDIRKISLTQNINNKSKIYPFLSALLHSIHLWSNLLMFILLENFVTTNVMPTTRIINKLENKTNISYSYEVCGFSQRPLYDSNWIQGNMLNNTLGYLYYISIGLNVTALILAIIMINHIRKTQKKHSRDSPRNVTSNTNITAGITTKMLSRRLSNDESTIDECDIGHRSGTHWLILYCNHYKTIIKELKLFFQIIWDNKQMRFNLPHFLTIGFLEGFLITDYNERLVSCYQDRPSFIGLSMLTYSLSPVLLVNTLSVFLLRQKVITATTATTANVLPITDLDNNLDNSNDDNNDIIIGQQTSCLNENSSNPLNKAHILLTMPIIRLILFTSIILLIYTEVARHWSYLLLFFPFISATDSVLTIQMFYVSSMKLPSKYVDNSVVLLRLLRMTGIAIYIFISIITTPYIAVVSTILVTHCFITPIISMCNVNISGFLPGCPR